MERKEVDELPITEKFFILSIRHRVPFEKALRMDGEQLFVYGVDMGWIDKDEVTNTLIEEVNIYKDNSAIAKGFIIGENEKTQFRFIKENSKWKIDLTGSMPELEIILEKMKKNLNLKSDNDAILYLLNEFTENPVSERIWIPLRKMR
jgi:hypothetical protein